MSLFDKRSELRVYKYINIIFELKTNHKKLMMGIYLLQENIKGKTN